METPVHRGFPIPVLDKPDPTCEDLLEVSEGLRLPVHLPGLYADTVLSDIWTLENLLSLDPDGEATVEYYADGDKRKRFTIVTKPFSELSRLIATEPEKWFIASQDFDEMFPKVASSLAPLPILPSNPRASMRSSFFGLNTRSAMHFHTRDQAILTHLRGTKRFVLTPPDTTKQIATNSPFGNRPQYSSHGPEEGQDAFDAFAKLVGDNNVGVVDMSAGDSLFIPVHWWHWVEGDGETLSVTTFWRARAGEWFLPAPGLRSIAAIAIAESVGMARTLLAMLTRSARRFT